MYINNSHVINVYKNKVLQEKKRIVVIIKNGKKNTKILTPYS